MSRQHLNEEQDDGQQDDHDILLVLTLVLLPMEGFVEENHEQQHDAHSAEPSAIDAAPDQRTDDADNGQNEAGNLDFSQIFPHGLQAKKRQSHQHQEGDGDVVRRLVVLLPMDEGPDA